MLEYGSILKTLLSGLLITLAISIISIIIGVGLSVLINRGLGLKNRIARGIIVLVMQIIKGIPILIQLFIVYYVLPFALQILTLNQFTTAIVVLSINAAVNLSDNAEMYSEILKYKVSEFKFKRINMLLALKEFGETIKNSLLVSFLGLIELFKAAMKINMESLAPFYGILLAAIIYLILYLIIYLVYRKLKSKYSPFVTEKVVNLENESLS